MPHEGFLRGKTIHLEVPNINTQSKSRFPNYLNSRQLKIRLAQNNRIKGHLNDVTGKRPIHLALPQISLDVRTKRPTDDKHSANVISGHRSHDVNVNIRGLNTDQTGSDIRVETNRRCIEHQTTIQGVIPSSLDEGSHIVISDMQETGTTETPSKDEVKITVKLPDCTSRMEGVVSVKPVAQANGRDTQEEEEQCSDHLVEPARCPLIIVSHVDCDSPHTSDMETEGNGEHAAVSDENVGIDENKDKPKPKSTHVIYMKSSAQAQRRGSTGMINEKQKFVSSLNEITERLRRDAVSSFSQRQTPISQYLLKEISFVSDDQSAVTFGKLTEEEIAQLSGKGFQEEQSEEDYRCCSSQYESSNTSPSSAGQIRSRHQMRRHSIAIHQVRTVL